MLKTDTKNALRVILLVLIISVILTSFASCFPEKPMPSKEEISANIDANDGSTAYQYVHFYLRDYGINNFDHSKFLWAEMSFQKYFNLKSGLPKVPEHAKLTAKSFLSDYYDKIDLTDKKAVTDALITCYVNAINDPYSIYRTPTEHDDYSTDMSGKFGGIGVVVEYDHTNEAVKVTSVYIDSPAEEAGIAPGDYIIGVDGKTIEDVGYLRLVDYVRGEIGTSVNIKLKRGDSIVEVSAKRAEIEEKTVDYIITDDNIGYVQIVGFKGNTFEQFVAAIDSLEEAKVDGIVFDLRGNPGGYVDAVCNMLSYLVPTGQTLVSYQYKGETATAIKSQHDIHPTKKDPQKPSSALVEDHVVKLPMVVICNEHTASAGELFTAAIRDYRDKGLLNARIVGQTSFGKGIMQSSIAYYDQSSITLTVAYYNPPCNVNYHDVGVTPDKVVENEVVDGVLADKQLSAAYEELKALINSN